MIEVDVAPRRTKIVAPAEEPARYLVLGDFGGRRTDILSVVRENINDVLSILHVTAGGMPIRSLADFHPDRLYQLLDTGLDGDAEPQPVSLQSDLAALLHSPLLEQI